MCALCNYRVAIVHYFKHLTMLDLQLLDAKTIKESEFIWATKKAYYRLRLEGLERQATAAARAGRAFFLAREEALRSELISLRRERGVLIRDGEVVASTSTSGSSASGGPDGPDKTAAIRQKDEAIFERERQLRVGVAFYQHFCGNIEKVRVTEAEALNRELESAGNLHFELPYSESVGALTLKINRELLLAEDSVDGGAAMSSSLLSQQHPWERFCSQLVEVAWHDAKNTALYNGADAQTVMGCAPDHVEVTKVVKVHNHFRSICGEDEDSGLAGLRWEGCGLAVGFLLLSEGF